MRPRPLSALCPGEDGARGPLVTNMNAGSAGRHPCVRLGCARVQTSALCSLVVCSQAARLAAQPPAPVPAGSGPRSAVHTPGGHAATASRFPEDPVAAASQGHFGHREAKAVVLWLWEPLLWPQGQAGKGRGAPGGPVPTAVRGWPASTGARDGDT